MIKTHVTTRPGVAALLRSGWQLCRIIGGSLRVNWVAEFSEIRSSIRRCCYRLLRAALIPPTVRCVRWRAVWPAM